MAKLKKAAIIKLKSEWMSLSQIDLVCSQGFVQNGWIQDGRIQDGCHHQVEREWMSFSQIELVWGRVLCKMGESKMAEFKMAAIIKLRVESEIELVWESQIGVRVFLSECERW